MKNNAGMTLIETVIVLGVAMVIVLTFGILAKDAYQVNGQAGNLSSMGDTYEVLRATLTSSLQCTKNFSGVGLDVTQPLGSVVQKISSFDISGSENSIVLQLAQNDHGLTVTGISIKPLAAVDTSLIVANLEITFQPASASNSIIRKIPFFAHVQDNKIVDCWSRKDQGEIEANQVCEIISNGVLNVYDPEQKKCVLQNGQWYDGILTSASCPSGTFLPANASQYTNCQAYFGSAFVDSFPRTTITMSDGTIHVSVRSPVRVTLSGGQCLCDWATDLSPASLVGSTCRILCVKP